MSKFKHIRAFEDWGCKIPAKNGGGFVACESHYKGFESIAAALKKFQNISEKDSTVKQFVEEWQHPNAGATVDRLVLYDKDLMAFQAWGGDTDPDFFMYYMGVAKMGSFASDLGFSGQRIIQTASVTPYIDTAPWVRDRLRIVKLREKPLDFDVAKKQFITRVATLNERRADEEMRKKLSSELGREIKIY